jgi:hypothetical protein
MVWLAVSPLTPDRYKVQANAGWSIASAEVSKACTARSNSGSFSRKRTTVSNHAAEHTHTDERRFFIACQRQHQIMM